MPLRRDFVRRLRQAGATLAGQGAYVPLTSNELDDRFNGAVIVSIIVHLAFIFGLTFKAANPALFQNVDALEVVLVNARSQTQPMQPDVLAQYSLDGGGDVEEDRQAKSPLTPSERDAPASSSALDRRLQALEAQTRQLVSQTRSDYAVREEPTEARAEPAPPVPAPVDLLDDSLEMARLQARISEDWEAYQKRPRRAFIGARAQEYSFARYVEDWRIKVERIGNLNYPEAARRDRIHGRLTLTVNVRADGSLEDVQIDRSSGSRILDAAALKIVQMSAPFAPFSEEMRKKVDILSITRSWHFTSSDQLLSEAQR
jgi:protein TonB